MLIQKIVIAVVIFLFCFNTDLYADDIILGWEAEGTFSVNFFSISSLSKATNQLINGNGVLREFDENSELIKEKKYDSMAGNVVIVLDVNRDGEGNDMIYKFNCEGSYQIKT